MIARRPPPGRPTAPAGQRPAQGRVRPAPLPVALGGAAVAAVVLFLMAERRQASPMLPLGLFRSRAFSAGTAVGVLFNLSLYGSLLCISLFLQQSWHKSAAATGLLILPMSVAVGTGSLASGRLTARFGPRLPMIAGLALAAAGAAVIATVSSGGPPGVLLAGSVILGLCSLAMPAMTSVVVGAAGRRHAGAASGVLNAARQAGGALGVALLGSLLTGTAQGQHALALHVPLSVAAGSLLAAVGLAWIATRPG